ncbi:MAG: sigma-70 family RNA polymerase sigma factor, partial [Actinomycetota bacterium]
MPNDTTDADLVAGHLAGDPGALAGIYDRYSDTLYDTAAAMLNDRDEAADVLQDTVLLAAERLGQLRDPSRLKPWLFAILRNEVYARTKRRRRTVATDFSDGSDDYIGVDMADDRQPDTGDAVAEQLAGDEMAALLRGAARGLDERDQLVLELSLRQGLDGQDLADALGVSANQSYTLVHRMRERVERSLGAYAIARAGRKDCDDLDSLLASWDGEFSVLIRKRVARHIDNCDTCSTNRTKVAPLALFAGAPALAAPPGLRDRILSKAGEVVPKPDYGFGAAGGFPDPLRAARRVAAWVPAPAAASVVLIAAVLGFALLGG